MSDISDASLSAARAPLYARFSSRLRAILLDTMIFSASMAGVLWIVSAVGSDDLSRPLGFIFVAGVLLYEPVLVSAIGGTIGHRMCNLRVVDDRHGGNVGFGKAVLRMIIKSLLGWYSFLVMMATRRNQAVHDLLTRSTVQIRNAALARSHEYVTESADIADVTLPSAFRRFAVIVVYLFVMFVGGDFVFDLLIPRSALSAACVNNGTCVFSETAILVAVGTGALAAIYFLIGFGWRGRLFGARKSAA